MVCVEALRRVAGLTERSGAWWRGEQTAKREREGERERERAREKATRDGC